MLIVLSVLWGGSFFFVGVAVSKLPPLTIVTLRVGLAAITLWTIALMMGLRPPKSIKIWLAFIGMGLLNNVIPFSLIVWGVVVVGLLLADERATPMKLISVAIGILGVVMMMGMPNLDVAEQGSTLAQMAILVAALSYAFASVFGRRFKTMELKPMVIAAGQVTGSSLVLAPCGFVC